MQRIDAETYRKLSEELFMRAIRGKISIDDLMRNVVGLGARVGVQIVEDKTADYVRRNLFGR